MSARKEATRKYLPSDEAWLDWDIDAGSREWTSRDEGIVAAQALAMLRNWGWTYLPSHEVFSVRGKTGRSTTGGWGGNRTTTSNKWLSSSVVVNVLETAALAGGEAA